jgi:hypothetical protein
MPELRTLVEHLVKTTVERTTAPSLGARHELEAAIERAVAPLVAKQRELEAALGDMRRESRHQASPGDAAQRAPEPTTSRGSVEVAAPPLAARAAPIAHALDAAPRPVAAKPRNDVIAVAYDANASWELPSELNGSRRKRVVIWLLAIGVVLLLGSVAGLAVLSNSGIHL